jgi:folate-binding protein YgfZ
MPDNLPQTAAAPPPAFFALPDHGVLELAGPDVVAFAQAQCMNDVAALGDRQWQWNGWLTPKGRLVALFALLRLEGERLWLVLPDYPAAALGERLQRFVFRSKLKLQVRDDLRVAGAFVAPTQASGPAAAMREGGSIELDLGADGGGRSLRIGPAEAPADAQASARWRAFDLAHGLPRLPDSQSEQFTPQMLSLQRLRAFSTTKGCYPGQEIVARTHFLGKAKRGLALLEGPRPMTAGAQLHVAGHDSVLGTLVSVASAADDRHLALTTIPVERDAGNLVVNEVMVREIALRAGLAR